METIQELVARRQASGYRDTEQSISWLLQWAKDNFACDAARISCPLGHAMFLVIGVKKSTKDGHGCWQDETGKRVDWTYLDEKCVASGLTAEELVESAALYKKLLGMTMEDYLNKATNG